MAEKHHVRFLHEGYDRDVNSAVELATRYSIGKRVDATVVVPQDLPLMGPQDIADVCKLAEKEKKCVVICPSLRRDGTNILLRKPPQVIPTHYDNNSYDMHLKAAKDLGVVVHEVESERLMFDIDTPEDVKLLVGMSKTTVAADVVAWFLRGRMSKKPR
jgi:2-phospho-L-lactate guanylyltransferase